MQSGKRHPVDRVTYARPKVRRPAWTCTPYGVSTGAGPRGMGQADSMRCSVRSPRPSVFLLLMWLASVRRSEGLLVDACQQEMNVSVLATNLGFPRVGLQRELKKVLE